MAAAWRDDFEDLEGEFTERRASGPPERQNRPVSRGNQSRARRTRSTEVAKRGMHQRRKKRIAW